MVEEAGPEFGIRMVGYSRREVDEFVAAVRRELRVLSGGTGEVRATTVSPTGEGAVARMVRLAAESADQRLGEAAEQAEQTLRSAREIADRMAAEAEELTRRAAAEAEERTRQAVADADRIMIEARQRAAELERRVTEMLDREVKTRVGDLARTHNRLVTGLSGMRDALVEVLERDAGRGPVAAPSLVPAPTGAE